METATRTRKNDAQQSPRVVKASKQTAGQAAPVKATPAAPIKQTPAAPAAINHNLQPRVGKRQQVANAQVAALDLKKIQADAASRLFATKEGRAGIFAARDILSKASPAGRKLVKDAEAIEAGRMAAPVAANVSQAAQTPAQATPRQTKAEKINNAATKATVSESTRQTDKRTERLREIEAEADAEIARIKAQAAQAKAEVTRKAAPKKAPKLPKVSDGFLNFLRQTAPENLLRMMADGYEVLSYEADAQGNHAQAVTYDSAANELDVSILQIAETVKDRQGKDATLLDKCAAPDCDKCKAGRAALDANGMAAPTTAKAAPQADSKANGTRKGQAAPDSPQADSKANEQTASIKGRAAHLAAQEAKDARQAAPTAAPQADSKGKRKAKGKAKGTKK